VKILLDESVPVQIRNALDGHQVSTAVEIGWHLELWTNHRPTLESHFDRIRAAAESTVIGHFRVLDENN
jgi:hypothetical protein